VFPGVIPHRCPRILETAQVHHPAEVLILCLLVGHAARPLDVSRAVSLTLCHCIFWNSSRRVCRRILIHPVKKNRDRTATIPSHLAPKLQGHTKQNGCHNPFPGASYTTQDKAHEQLPARNSACNSRLDEAPLLFHTPFLRLLRPASWRGQSED
jgi:hypothetical protein